MQNYPCECVALSTLQLGVYWVVKLCWPSLAPSQSAGLFRDHDVYFLTSRTVCGGDVQVVGEAAVPATLGASQSLLEDCAQPELESARAKEIGATSVSPWSPPEHLVDAGAERPEGRGRRQQTGVCAQSERGTRRLDVTER